MSTDTAMPLIENLAHLWCAFMDESHGVEPNAWLMTEPTWQRVRWEAQQYLSTVGAPTLMFAWGGAPPLPALNGPNAPPEMMGLPVYISPSMPADAIVPARVGTC